MTSYKGYVVSLTHTQTYKSIDSVIKWKHDDIRNWIADKSKLISTRGGCTFGDRTTIKYLQGLVWWINDQILRRLEVNLDEFNAGSTQHEAIDMSIMYNELKDSTREANDKQQHLLVALVPCLSAL